MRHWRIDAISPLLLNRTAHVCEGSWKPPSGSPKSSNIDASCPPKMTSVRLRHSTATDGLQMAGCGLGNAGHLHHVQPLAGAIRSKVHKSDWVQLVPPQQTRVAVLMIAVAAVTARQENLPPAASTCSCAGQAPMCRPGFACTALRLQKQSSACPMPLPSDELVAAVFCSRLCCPPVSSPTAAMRRECCGYQDARRQRKSNPALIWAGYGSCGLQEPQGCHRPPLFACDGTAPWAAGVTAHGRRPAPGATAKPLRRQRAQRSQQPGLVLPETLAAEATKDHQPLSRKTPPPPPSALNLRGSGLMLLFLAANVHVPDLISSAQQSLAQSSDVNLAV
eukprot:CAMPEP_0179159870 /NCGR_PEP_ID=MMETSP0796-20121207/78113_1 /TAXON_ID=73915 /ORGANISM="Pyrodinium bahamense, Strain pbaha01" /LENGTH=334 /DNA_ID=CAMNT_0020861715 /DNA_START=83 /DNA_END=1089 /DNA_ORIENTATION=-